MHPLVSRVLFPALTSAIARFLEKKFRRIQVKASIKAAKAAYTAEELRLASEKLSNSVNR